MMEITYSRVNHMVSISFEVTISQVSKAVLDRLIIPYIIDLPNEV